MGIKIEKIIYDEDIPVYDLTVPGTSSFFANDILVHNCTEIAIPSSIEETFTCVLSSLNLLRWKELLETDAIQTLIYFLDSVVSEFIDKTAGKPYLERARRFAERHRALGMGVLGWHSFLQSNMIALESEEAMELNRSIIATIDERSMQATKELAALYGEPELLIGKGQRNTTRLAIAPTKSSSFILGQVSQSTEPEFSNCYVKDLAKTKVTIKNQYLQALLEEKGMNTDVVWEQIKNADGSVIGLDFLTQHEKDVFKTFPEISSEVIIRQAADRQKHVDQAQSINLMLDPDTPVKEINSLYLLAWELGIKSLYYSYSMSKAQTLTRKKVTAASKKVSVSDTDCAACEA